MNKKGALSGISNIRNWKYENYPNRSTDELLEGSYKIPKENIPPVRNQKDYNACVGFATSNLLTVFNYKETGIKEIFDAFYIYGKLRDYNDEGMYLEKTLKFMLKEGSVPESMCGIEGEMPAIKDAIEEFVKIHPEYVELAQHYKISAYVDLINDDSNITLDNISRVLRDTKMPVILITNHFGDYHCVVGIGSNTKNKTVEILNSWDIDWENNGTGFIPVSSIVECYMVLDDENIKLTFKDVDESNDYYDDIKNMVLSGIFVGRSEDEYSPKEPLLRDEAAAVANRIARECQKRIDRLYEMIKNLSEK